MTLYERIRKLRVEAGMTQDDLAKAMGYKDRSMITKIESGKVDISQKKVVEFAKVLNTTPAYLMGWNEGSKISQLNLQLFADGEAAPKTPEARILARGIDKLPQAQREQALAVVRAMFAAYADYFFDNKETDDHDSKL